MDATTPPILLAGTSRIARKPDVPWKELDGTGIILALDTGDYFELNGIGLGIWKMLDGTQSLSACASSLAATHEIPFAQAESDLHEFVNDLRAQNLVTVLS